MPNTDIERFHYKYPSYNLINIINGKNNRSGIECGCVKWITTSYYSFILWRNDRAATVKKSVWPPYLNSCRIRDSRQLYIFAHKYVFPSEIRTEDDIFRCRTVYFHHKIDLMLCVVFNRREIDINSGLIFRGRFQRAADLYRIVRDDEISKLPLQKLIVESRGNLYILDSWLQST